MIPSLEEARKSIQLAHIDRPEYADGIVRCLKKMIQEWPCYITACEGLARNGYSAEQIKEAGVWFKRMKGVKI